MPDAILSAVRSDAPPRSNLPAIFFLINATLGHEDDDSVMWSLLGSKILIRVEEDDDEDDDDEDDDDDDEEGVGESARAAPNAVIATKQP